jgi:DNA polymerase-3 subunit epsilon
LKFDLPLLVEEFFRCDIELDIKHIRMIDVQNIFHKMEQRTLAAAYKFYCNRELINAHSAEADTLATLEVLKAQIEQYEGVEYKDRDGNVSTPVKNDIKALHEFSIVHPFADLVGHLIFNEKREEVFNFGKHKGKAVSEIFKVEPAYYNWMMNADFPESTKKVITAIKLRDINSGSVKVK